jgi:hypothetical protein
MNLLRSSMAVKNIATYASMAQNPIGKNQKELPE